MTSIHLVAPLWRKSAIGRVTNDLAAELARHHDVTIFAEHTNDPLSSAVPVRPLENLTNSELRSCGQLITVLGNSALHQGALRVARAVPSIVILHDIQLAGLFLSALSHSELHEILSRYYGAAAASNALQNLNLPRSVWHGPDAMRMPLFEAAIERAEGVIVHSHFAAALVRAATIAPVEVIPLACSAPTVESDTDAEVPSGDFMLTLGQANENKCHELSIDALAAIPGSACRYVIAGPITDRRREHLTRRAERVGLGDRVTMTGQISDGTVAALVERATVCVNLRSPAFESGSASLLEQMHAARAVVVFDHGCYADVPDDAVVKLALGSSAHDLAQVLSSLLGDRRNREALGARAASYVSSVHRFDAYADQLGGFFSTVAAAGPMLGLADAVASRTKRWGVSTQSELPARWAGVIADMLPELVGSDNRV